jgi:Flp pilus assembly protein TadD
MSSVGNLATMLSVQGRHKDAESLFREALRDERRLLGEDHPDTVNTLYNLACNSALRGDRRGALDWLGQAVAHGLSNPDMIARDADLKVLRGDPAFEALVNRARKNSTR